MLSHSLRKSFKANGLIFQIIVGCGIGLILGISSIWISPLRILVILTAALPIYAILRKPEIALLGILIATSSIIFEDKLPLLYTPMGSLHVADIPLIGLLGFIALRWLVEPNLRIVRTPLDWPLLIFYGVTLLSTFIAIFNSSVEVEEARRWIRILSYYLNFFIVTNLVRERRQLKFLLNGIFILATFVAGAMVVQYLLGDSARLLPGRVETLDTQGQLFANVVRIAPPGFSIVLVSFVSIFCILVIEKFKPLGWLKFLQWGLLGMALLVTFLRSYWAVLIMAFVLLGFLLRGVYRQRLIGWGLLVVSLVGVILLLVFRDPDSQETRLVGALIDRVGTLGKSGTFQGQDGSFNWRMIENGYAISTVTANPWIGLGMGFTYRPWDPRIDTVGASYDFRKHIHNGHLWILLQSGLLGYLSFMWLSFAFLIRGFRYWRSITSYRMRGVVLGFSLVYLAVLIAAVTNSTFMQQPWTPVIGIIMGINEVILMRFRQEESAD